MVDVDSAQIARLKTHGHNFEILVNSSNAIALKGGSNVSMSDVLAVPKVFSDAKKGLEASANTMKEVFQVDDPIEVAKIIIQKGEIPLTAEYKNQLREQKKKKIIELIHRDAVDPKTHLPHPPQRIENAMEEAKVRIDESMDVNKQLELVLKKIRPVLPIKFEVKEIAVKIPADYAAKSYSIVNSFGKKLKEEWQSDGSMVVVLEIPGGLEEDLHNKLNELCHGETETKILNTR